MASRDNTAPFSPRRTHQRTEDPAKHDVAVSSRHAGSGGPAESLTRLEAFIRSRGIKPLHLAKTSGLSRQHLLRIRKGTMDPTRRLIAAITRALATLTGEPVEAADIFDLD